ncbi:hypothetical protein [Treponema parvum]|uniref:hypothetical protein n=1 Tax=Treponema parvum TaxID=138851 RepID=UPI001AEC1623|nr:hypothetical protein [Treponema parvum]QTQ16585.1 hypothetical protein HXT04_07720 [Treponema parvum]
MPVRYSKEHPEANKQAEAMLLAWESGDKNIHKIWKRMNDWAIEELRIRAHRGFCSMKSAIMKAKLTAKEKILEGPRRDFL